VDRESRPRFVVRAQSPSITAPPPSRNNCLIDTSPPKAIRSHPGEIKLSRTGQLYFPGTVIDVAVASVVVAPRNSRGWATGMAFGIAGACAGPDLPPRDHFAVSGIVKSLFNRFVE